MKIDEVVLRAFYVFNRHFFQNKLPVPKVVLDLSKKFPIRYLIEEEAIVIGADFQEITTVDCFLVSVLHEMVHCYNHFIGRPDYGAGAGANYYHNKHFSGLALEVGLIVLKHKSQGFAITTIVMPRNVVHENSIRLPSKEAVERRNIVFASVQLDVDTFEGVRLFMMDQVANIVQKNYFLKYICQCLPPHNSIRSGRRPDGPHALKITCNDCGAQFVCDQK